METETQHREAEASRQNGLPVIETTQARQAVATGHVRYVLAISTVLVVVAFATIYFLNA